MSKSVSRPTETDDTERETHLVVHHAKPHHGHHHDHPIDPEDEEEVRKFALSVSEAVRVYETYDDYLNSQISETDLFYLGNHRAAQQILERGLDRNHDKFTREKFDREKANVERRHRAMMDAKISNAFSVRTDDAVLVELARRKSHNEAGRLATIIFLRIRNEKGQEISAYIDYAHRLTRDEAFKDILAGFTQLQPEHTDLTFYNWDTRISHFTDSPNFTVIAGTDFRMQFKHRKDHRILSVSRQGKGDKGADVGRTVIRSKVYSQVTLYDHWVRYWSSTDDYDEEPIAQLSEHVVKADKMGLHDVLSTVIMEEDLVSIARNALGISTKESDSVESMAERCKPDEAFAAQRKLQRTIDGTMETLYDIERNDVRNATLGTFDYTVLLSKFEGLLPSRFHDWPQTAQSGSSAKQEVSPNSGGKPSFLPPATKFAPEPFMDTIRALIPEPAVVAKPSTSQDHFLHSPLVQPRSGLMTSREKLPVTRTRTISASNSSRINVPVISGPSRTGPPKKDSKLGEHTYAEFQKRMMRRILAGNKANPNATDPH